MWILVQSVGISVDFDEQIPVLTIDEKNALKWTAESHRFSGGDLKMLPLGRHPTFFGLFCSFYIFLQELRLAHVEWSTPRTCQTAVPAKFKILFVSWFLRIPKFCAGFWFASWRNKIEFCLSYAGFRMRSRSLNSHNVRSPDQHVFLRMFGNTWGGEIWKIWDPIWWQNVWSETCDVFSLSLSQSETTTVEALQKWRNKTSKSHKYKSENNRFIYSAINTLLIHQKTLCKGYPGLQCVWLIPAKPAPQLSVLNVGFCPDQIFNTKEKQSLSKMFPKRQRQNGKLCWLVGTKVLIASSLPNVSRCATQNVHCVLACFLKQLLLSAKIFNSK